VTAPARITQADIERATKAVAAAGFERVRLVLDFDARKIEIIIGESTGDVPTVDEWDEEIEK
jgi:hypothetical protein